MFLKLGENIEISRIEDSDSCIPEINQETLDNFTKIAAESKKIAPRADDFLYFSAVIIHAAEASAINDDGSPKNTSFGDQIKVSWDKTGNTWKWVTNDPGIKPYKNCFVPGTQILMSDGTTKNIEDVEVDDLVITHKGVAKKVLNKFITPHNGNLIELSVRNGKKILTTENHPFYKLNQKSSIKEFKFVPANELKINDILTSPLKFSKFLNKECIQDCFYKDYVLCDIADINTIEYSGNVYNIEVEEDNSYVANDIIVHNCNGDIFPEAELIKVYRKWVGKPLCIDHKSNSVDHVRGFIVDTHYDRELKRIVALCALDKKNYPELARKVSTGYSNSVSIGVAVGTAICTDCYKTARTEADFCQHMKNKNGYGEINIDLNPIELSIVVNGADTKAKIKHILAAANDLNSYVENKEKEIKKIAAKFTATLTVSNDESEDTTHSANFSLQSNNLESLKQDVDEAFKKLEEINKEISKKDTNEVAYNQSSSKIAMDEAEVSSNNLELAPPSARFASTITTTTNDTNSVDEIKKITANIENKLNIIKQSLDKILNISNKEENMSGSNEISKKGYYQGTEDPTPGKPKYTKEPQNEDLRLNEDKQMIGQMDTGPVDGLHPGPDSVGMSELERKKMLARAESEERAMRRNAIVNLAKKSLEQRKEAYFQGGGGVNEPTPGKQKYPVDKLQYTLRDDEDKHMAGQKPFPDVGAVDKLHPSPDSADTADELKRKEMLRRAALRARFIKAANHDGSQNLGASAWEVFLGDKLLLTASVDDLSGGRSSILYDSIATKEFGTKLIEKIKTQGVDKVRSLVKSAQTPPAAPPPPAALPPSSPDSSAPPALDAAAPAEDPSKFLEGKDAPGDVEKTAPQLVEQLKQISSDLGEAVQRLTDEKGEIPKEELAGPEGAQPGMGALASNKFSTKTLNSLRRELNGALTHAMKEAIADINDHSSELNMIIDIYNGNNINNSNKDLVQSISEDSINEAKTAIADAFKLMTAFIKYARGTQAIVKRAQLEQQELEETSSDDDEKLMSLLDEPSAQDEEELKRYLYPDELGLEKPEETDSEELSLGEPSLYADDDASLEADDDMSLEADDYDSVYSDDTNEVDAVPGDKVIIGKDGKPVTGADGKPVAASLNLNTKHGRIEYRAKLAAQTLKMSPLLHDAHPKGGFTTELDVKPSDDLAKVEDLEEVHDAMLDLANAPPKVRKEAEAIHMLIKQGKLDPKDLDALVAEGLDPAAVKYYKQYYGQVDGGSEFATELVKEHVKAQMEEELNKFKVKMAAAYELTYDMVDRNLCYNDRGAISSQVDEIMKFSDDNFDSLKRVVARHSPLRKEASKIPQVGLIGSGEVGSVSSDDSLFAQLSSALSKDSRRVF